MNFKCLGLLLLLAAVQVNAAELSGNIIKVETSGATVNSIKWNDNTILARGSLMLQNDTGAVFSDSGPNTAVRMYENDAEYLKFEGKMKQGGNQVVAYWGKILL